MSIQSVSSLSKYHINIRNSRRTQLSFFSLYNLTPETQHDRGKLSVWGELLL